MPREGKGNLRLVIPGITGNGNSRSPLIPPNHPHHQRYEQHGLRCVFSIGFQFRLTARMKQPPQLMQPQDFPKNFKKNSKGLKMCLRLSKQIFLAGLSDLFRLSHKLLSEFFLS